MDRYAEKVLYFIDKYAEKVFDFMDYKAPVDISCSPTNLAQRWRKKNPRREGLNSLFRIKFESIITSYVASFSGEEQHSHPVLICQGTSQ